MKTTSIIFAAIGALLVVGGVYKAHQSLKPVIDDHVPAPVIEGFALWKQKFGKEYGTSHEDNYRVEVYWHNLLYIGEQEESGISYELGLNQFADLTSEEFVASFTGYNPAVQSLQGSNPTYLNCEGTPDSVDWTDKGAVTEVKNQGHCGSCYTFSSTGALEGLHFIKTGKLESFSEQELVDCAKKDYGVNGCSGGFMDPCFKYARDHGLMKEADYPYQGVESGSCSADDDKAVKNINTSYHDVPEDDNCQLVAAIAQQPVSVAVQANKLQLYTTGVFDIPDCGDQLNHAILAVGYGVDAATGKKFYKVKNSWGPKWGESGYVRMVRKDEGEGICGITKKSSYPTA